MIPSKSFWRHFILVGVLAAMQGHAAAQSRAISGDYIAAIVNQELVTAGEIERRIQRAKQDAARGGARLPPDRELREQVQALVSLWKDERTRQSDTF